MKKPTIQEVSDYCAQRGNGIDPEQFWDYQESVGWVVGKSRKPMKSWQAAVRTWERNNRQRQHQPRRMNGQPWQESIDTLAAKLGLQAKPGESWEQFAAKVRAAATRAH